MAQSQDVALAREKFVMLCRDKFPDPVQIFDQQSSALQAMGLIER